MSISRMMGAMVLAVMGLACGAAQASFHVCNGCGYSEVSTMAEGTSPPPGVMAEVFVADYHHVVIWRCEVWRETEVFPAGNFSACGHAPADIQDDFLEISQLLAQANSAIEIDYPGGDVYEISGCPACARSWVLDNQHAIANRLSLVDILKARGWTLGGKLGGRNAEVEASVSGQVRVKLVVRNDASGAREKGFCFADLTANGLQVDVDSCVDGDGNPIPTLESPNIQVTYAFTSAVNVDRMVARLRVIGRPVRGTGTVTVRPLISCGSEVCEADEPAPDEDDN